MIWVEESQQPTAVTKHLLKKFSLCAAEPLLNGKVWLKKKFWKVRETQIINQLLER